MKDPDDHQTIDAFQTEPKKSGRGGARPGAGRPKLRPTVVMRVPVGMVDAVKLMIEADSNGLLVEYRLLPKEVK